MPVQCSVDAYYTKVYVEEAYFAIYLVAIKSVNPRENANSFSFLDMVSIPNPVMVKSLY